ncbi:MAG: TIGR02206 family membrane protein [Candidatus Omnitrophica bacterium]|nr:TIGR02206 family membrane protein [Candidatus Omnitrophota bacterium]
MMALHVAPFVLWEPAHRLMILATAAGALGVVRYATRLRSDHDHWVRHGLAVALLANEVLAWALAILQGHAHLPIQLCELALLLTVWALWSLGPSVSEVAYFWGLGGSLQAILTPDVPRGFPDYWWIKFFISHCGVVLGVIYLAVTGRIAPTHRSVWRVLGLTNLYAASAVIINGMFGTNYGYLAQKPAQPSLLDYFGPWPWYILGMEGVALLSLYGCYAPFAAAFQRLPKPAPSHER